MSATLITNYSNWLPVLNGQLTDKFNERLASRVDTDTGYKIFGVEARDEYNSAYQVLPSFGGIQYLTEGQDFPELTAAQGYKKVYQTKRFGASFRITKEVWMYLKSRYSEIAGLPENMMDDAADKIDGSFAGVLNNGWSTSYTDVFNQTVDGTTPDGVAFFSTAHRAAAGLAAYSNIINDGVTPNPVFGRTPIVKAMIQGATFTDSAGILRPIEFDTLLVGPDLYDTALRTIKSEFIPGSNNNDINASITDLKIVKWNRIGTGKWFLMDSMRAKQHSLMARFGQKPELATPFTIPQNMTLLYTCDFLYHIVLGDPRYVFGSNGTAA